MFHKIKSIKTLEDFKLLVQFGEGLTKEYDVKPLFEKWKPFLEMKKDPSIFEYAYVDKGGYGVCFNDNLDLSKNTREYPAFKLELRRG